MAQSSGYGAGPGAVDLSAGVTGGTTVGGGTTDADSQSTAGQAKEKVQDVAGQAAGQAKEQAQHVAGQARGAVRGQVDQRSTQAGQQVNSQASDIRSVAEQLRSQGKDGPAKLADQAAERAERVGSYLTNADADTIIDDVERFARSNPWAVIAGGIAVGFVAARALKASSVERYQYGGSAARRQQLPRAGATYGGRYGGTYGGYDEGGYGSGFGAGTGAGTGAGVGTGGAISGGGITGGPDIGTPIPPASSVPPVSGTGGTGTPPAGGF